MDQTTGQNMGISGFLLGLKAHKNYTRILLGVKSGIAFFGLFCCISLVVKKVDVPVTIDDLYTYAVPKEYDIVLDETVSEEKVANTDGILVNLDEDVQKQLPQKVMNIIATPQEKEHGVGDDYGSDVREKAIQKVCEQYKDFCAILHFNGDLSPKDRYAYTAVSVYFLDMINTSLQEGGKKSLFDGLKSLTLRAQLSKDLSEGACYTQRRGCANHNEVILNLELIKTPIEYIHTLVHEIGHITDLGVLIGVAREYDKDFKEFSEPAFKIDDISLAYYGVSWQGELVRKKGAKTQDFCSMYSMTNIFEDFAECSLMFKNHNFYFKTLAQTNRVLYKKYQFFSNLHAGKYIFANPKKAAEVKKGKDADRVRDLTKIQ